MSAKSVWLDRRRLVTNWPLRITEGPAASRLAWGLWALGILLVGLHLALLVINAAPPQEWAARAGESGIIVMGLTFGMLVATRHPENSIGWLFFVAPFAGASWGITEQYAHRALVAHPGSLPAGEFVAWLSGWVRWVALLPCMLGLLLFPTGSLISHRWALVAWLTIPGVAGIALAQAISPGPLSGLGSVENPYGIEGRTPAVFLDVAYAFTLLFLVPTTFLSQVARYRCASASERQQIKWVAFGGAFFASAFALFSVIIFLLPGAPAGPFLAELLPTVGISVLVLAAGTAILRYQLYDIDLIINQTLVYGSLTTATVALYFTLVVGFGWLLRAATGQGSNELAIAATTPIVAALFQPARRRIQSTVDLRFYRSRYDAAQTVEAFQARLRNQTDLESLRTEVGATVQTALQPTFVDVWLRPGTRTRNDLVPARDYRNARTE